MPQYQYKGVDENKKRVSGSSFALTEDILYHKLKETGIFAYEITQGEEKTKSYAKLKTKELSDFARQIGTMQASGISVMKAIDIMRDRDIPPKVRNVYDTIYQVVNQGNSLTEGMQSCSGAFPTLMISMFQAAEMSGQTEEIAAKMAQHYESEGKISSKIKGAMAYPTILVVVMVIVVAILFTFVLPVFFGMYEGTDSELPGPTQVVQNISIFMGANWYWVLIGGSISFFLIRMICKIEAVATGIDHFKIVAPKVGPLLCIIYTARFARTMSSVYSSGLPMIQSVEIAAKTVGNLYIESQFSSVIRRVEVGNPLSVALKEVPGFESKLVSSIYIGEESGRLDHMLNSLANEYEFEADAAISRLLTFIEPVLILVMAVVIGGVMVAVMLPMFNMSSAIM